MGGKNEKPKLRKFISVGGVNKNIANFIRENMYELFLTKEILEHIVNEKFFKILYLCNIVFIFHILKHFHLIR